MGINNFHFSVLLTKGLGLKVSPYLDPEALVFGYKRTFCPGDQIT